MGKGSNTTTSSQQAPQWLQNNLQSLYGQAQNITSAPLQQYGGSTIAGFSPDQQSAFNTINNAQGVTTPYYNAAAQEISNSTQPIWNQTQQFSPSAVSQYQSPYTQQVVNATQAQLNQNDQVQQQQLEGNAISSGASPFGGDRAGVAAAALAGQQDLANNQTISNLYNTGYTQALGEFNTQQQAQLGANEATSYLGQQGAAGLQNLGTNTQQAALSGASAQLQSGALQQQLGQEQLNAPYEQFVQQQAYPYQQLSALESAAGLTGSLAGGTSSTTGPSPSATSQLGGLGLTGLGVYGATQGSKRGGVAAYANGGALPHYDNGGSALPQVPDLSISYINPSAGGSFKSDIPTAPKTTTQTTASNSGLSPSGLGLNAGSMKEIGSGVNALWNGTGSSGGIGGMLGMGSPASNALAGTEEMPAGMAALDSAATPTGASISSLIPGAAADVGASAAGDAGIAAASDAALADVGMDAGDLAFMAMFAKKGGVAHYASGGNTAVATPSGTASSPAFTYIAGENGIAVPQLNNSAIYNTSPQENYNGINALTPISPNAASVISTPSALASAPSSASTSSSPISTPAIIDGIDQAPSSSYQTNFPGLTTTQYNQMLNAVGSQYGGTYGNAYNPGLGSQYNQYITQQGWKSGGVAHYDTGGTTPFDTSTNPQANNYTSQFAQMNPQQLRQLAQRVPPGTPQAQIIAKVLQQKQAMPNVGQQPGMAAMGPTAQSAPMGGAGPQPAMASGGIAHYADGGDEEMSPQLTADDTAASPDAAQRANILQALDPDGGPDNAARTSSPEIESQKDDNSIVDHSGNTVVVKHPSTGESIDLGIPSAKNTPTSFDKWSPVIAAGLGMMAGTSPFAAVNVGRGGLEGLQQYAKNKQEALEQEKQGQVEKYQTGELGLRGQQIAQTGSYQQGELQNNAQRNSIEAAHWKAMEDLTRQKMNSGLPSVDPETGDIVQGNVGAVAKANGFGFPVTQIPPTVFHAMSTEDSKRKQLENNNFPVANNVMRILDQLEPNLSNFDTGEYSPSARATVGKFFGTDSGTAAANIEKGTNDLATELGKFQYTPGQRGSVLGLQTILASKPGIQQPKQTNENIVNGLRAKVTDYTLSSELNQQYREASPYKITDSNTQELDRALKNIYPIEQIDPKTGVTMFNKDNAQKIRDSIPDAIANPQKYFSMAKQNAQTKSIQQSKVINFNDLPQ